MLDESYVLVFSALSNPTRLAIVKALTEGEKTVGELTKEIGKDQTTISHSLKKLYQCGMVRIRKKGRFRYYSLTSNAIKYILKIAEEHINAHCPIGCNCEHK